MFRFPKAQNSSSPGLLLYATREILLVVTGILIALYFNKRNEKRKQEAQFNALLQQYYNAVFKDNELLQNSARLTAFQMVVIDSLLNQSTEIPSASIPWLLHAVCQDHQFNDFESRQLRPFLNYQSGNELQNAIIKQLLSYGQIKDAGGQYWYLPLSQQLINSGIPTPELFPAGIGTSYLNRNPPPFFNESQIALSKEWLRDAAFHSQLISLKTEKAGRLRYINSEIENGNSIIQSIRGFHPKVRLAYEDLGIIGDALESGWTQSVPMRCTDPGQGIWEIELTLKTGAIKFRDRNSWKDNWGSFFNGRANLAGKLNREGSDIMVEAGEYLIEINPMKSEFVLTPLKTHLYH